MKFHIYFFAVIVLCVSGCVSGSGVARIKLMRMQAKDYFTQECQITLLKGVEKGDIAQMDAALKLGANVNAVGYQEITPLGWAIAKQNKAGFLWLLQHGANPNFKIQPKFESDQATSTMALSALLEDSAYLQMALDHGGDPNATDGYPDKFHEKTIIHTAIENHRKENVKLLAKYGADLNRKNGMGFTPIEEAAMDSQFDMVLLLMDLGANPSLKDNYNWDLSRILKSYGSNPAHPEQLKYYNELIKRLKLE